jgi:hypothetical protein
MTPVSESQFYKNLTATTTVYTGNGGVLGVFVASTTSGTLKFSDGANTIVNTFSPSAATFYPIPAQFGTSLIVTVGGTIDCTVFWTN